MLSAEGYANGQKSCWVKNSRLFYLDVEIGVRSSLISSGAKYLPEKNFWMGLQELASLLQNPPHAFSLTVRTSRLCWAFSFVRFAVTILMASEEGSFCRRVFNFRRKALSWFLPALSSEVQNEKVCDLSTIFSLKEAFAALCMDSIKFVVKSLILSLLSMSFNWLRRACLWDFMLFLNLRRLPPVVLNRVRWVYNGVVC